MNDVHFIAQWQACRAGAAEMKSAPLLRECCLRLVASAGLSAVGECFHQFASEGVTGAILLPQSLLAVRSEPQSGLVTADFHIWSASPDCTTRARQLMERLQAVFAPARAIHHEFQSDGSESTPAMLSECLSDDYRFSLAAGERLLAARSSWQDIEVWKTPGFGRLFRLDGSFMSSERDEFFYHENLVHPAAISHPAPRSALVIGGGDGGSAKELLKHPSIERVTVVEIDAAVIAMAREHLAGVHQGAFDDPRVELVIADGFAYVHETRAQFDLIVLELTDPGDLSDRLHSPAFYQACAARLAPGGSMSMHIGAPFFQPERFRRTLAELGQTFACVRPILVAVPLYGALWGLACASSTLDPKTIDPATVATRLAARRIRGLRYYNPETHAAVLAMPGFVAELTRG